MLHIHERLTPITGSKWNQEQHIAYKSVWLNYIYLKHSVCQCTKNHLLIGVLFILFNVGDWLRANAVGNLIGAQGDSKDVLVVAVLILGGWENGLRSISCSTCANRLLRLLSKLCLQIVNISLIWKKPIGVLLSLLWGNPDGTFSCHSHVWRSCTLVFELQLQRWTALPQRLYHLSYPKPADEQASVLQAHVALLLDDLLDVLENIPGHCNIPAHIDVSSLLPQALVHPLWQLLT